MRILSLSQAHTPIYVQHCSCSDSIAHKQRHNVVEYIEKKITYKLKRGRDYINVHMVGAYYVMRIEFHTN